MSITVEGVTVQELPLSKIVNSPYQPRLMFDGEKLRELAQSINEIGLGKPITVRPLPDGYFELVGGERRCRAVTMLGWKSILAIVQPMADDMAMVLALTDNEHEQLTDYERARRYVKCLETGIETSQRALARRLGVNVSTVSRCLQLMQLPGEVRAVLNLFPWLISANYAKQFVDLAQVEPHIVTRVVNAMKPSGMGQEAALRLIASKIAAKSGTGSPATQVRAIEGLGRFKVAGNKLEFKCDRNIDPHRLMAQFEVFLETIDAAALATTD